MDVETATNPRAAQQQDPPAQRNTPTAFVWTFLLFVAFWAMFHELFQALPYLKNGSDVVFSSKLEWEQTGQVFPDDPAVTRVLIFGNSKILAGFIPDLFDQISSTGARKVASFNSGFPGSALFLPPLQAMCERGQAPNVLLLTLPWTSDPPKRDIFHFIPDDHAVVERLFPFRNFVRDLTAFLLNAPSHGGVISYYHEAEENAHDLFAQRGYHLITEQSHFPGGRLPDDFRLESDQPAQVLPRSAPSQGAEIRQLNQLVDRYHMHCYYVPIYLRQGEAAPAVPYDTRFAELLAQTTSCKLLGPDYYLYANHFFADQTHLNRAGAQVYTETLFHLLKESGHALQ